MLGGRYIQDTDEEQDQAGGKKQVREETAEEEKGGRKCGSGCGLVRPSPVRVGGVPDACPVPDTE